MHALGEDEELITKAIIGKAIAIHRGLGPGLLESVYEYFLVSELRKGGFIVEQQKPLSVEYKLLSYLRLAKIERGLLINFHAFRLADGIKRLSLRKK